MKPIPAPEPFHWRTAEGIVTTPPAMTTTHLFYAARMVFNHTVEDPLRLKPFREWPAVYDWSADARRDAMEAFLGELVKRTSDLTPGQSGDLTWIALHRKAFDEEIARISAGEWDDVESSWLPDPCDLPDEHDLH